MPLGCCPTVWETLQALALKGRQAADKESHFGSRRINDTLILADVLIAGPFLISPAQRPHRFLIQLRDCMMVSSCQGVCNVLLITAAVAAVLWLTVNGIANDTVNGCILLHKRNIVSSSAIPCRHGRCHPVRASIASINAVVLVDQRLVSIKRPERAPARPALAPATERS